MRNSPGGKGSYPSAFLRLYRDSNEWPLPLVSPHYSGNSTERHPRATLQGSLTSVKANDQATIAERSDSAVLIVWGHQTELFAQMLPMPGKQCPNKIGRFDETGLRVDLN